VRLQRRGTVRAHDLKVPEPVVGRDSVDVIEDQRHAPVAPLLALAAELTPPLFDLLRVQPALGEPRS